MPEFPLSRPDLKQTEAPREHRGRSGMDFEGHHHWRLVQIQYYANLQPSQIVREMDAPDRGWEADPAKGDEHAPRAARQDATADSDRQRENTNLVTVDERRYVVDPVVGDHTYTGLWTGGPIQYVVAQGRKVLRQTLTRTWCAGHGYKVASDGSYVAVWPNGSKPSDAGGVHGTGSAGKAGVGETREYRTAKECLKACRPWMDGRLSPYMAFRTDIPGSFTREVLWREFTHESITPLESLSREDLVEIVTYHFGAKVGPTVMDAHTRVDPNTNTVIFVCSLLYSELGEPEDADDLLDLPCIDGPCSRETLRMFGWGQLRDGEGYEYMHYFRWPRLKDSAKTRATIEFVQDNATCSAVSASDAPDGIGHEAGAFILSLIGKHRTNTSAPGWWASYEDAPPTDDEIANPADRNTQLDNTGRIVTTVHTGTYQKTSGSGSSATTTDATDDTPEVQHYRIAQQKVDVEQDGSLVFTIIVAKAEWHGYDDGKDYEATGGGRRQLASVSNPDGYARNEHRVIPSVPRENAIDTMNAIEAGEYETVTQKSQTEGQKGSSDVSFQRGKLYNYYETDHTPDDVINIDGTEYNAPDYSYDPEHNVYRLTYPLVKAGDVQNLVDHVRGLLGGDPKINIRNDGNGSYTVSVTGKALNPRHVQEWTVEADWFQHQTLEQWIGAAVQLRNGVVTGVDSNTGLDITANIVGFFTEYTRDQSTHLIVPVQSSFVPIEAIRGDLDAGWMGSQPQHPGSGSGGSPILYYTIGTGDSKQAADPEPEHDDVHGDGWVEGTGSMSWTDPDSSTDTQDKARSHVLTQVHLRVNGDGTFDISITRIYPHQRAWEWETEKRSGKGGEWKPVYHIEYRNWPSRKEIKRDLVDRWAALKGVNLNSDEYIFNFSPNVNKFGLVDAANVTIEPLFWTASKAKTKDEGDVLEDLSDYRFYAQTGRPTKARVSPDSVDHAPPFAPLLGFYFCVEKLPCYEGTFNDYASAKTAWDALEEKYGEADSSSKTPQQVGSSTRYHFIYRGGWRRGKIAYNGMMPVVAKNQHGQGVGSTTKQGIKGLSRKTWELWFMGAENMGH